jgi:hypothetical protein
MDLITHFINSLGLGDSATMWVIFVLASFRGLAATASELLPDRVMGPLAPVINVLAGNNLNSTGSQ